MAALGLGSFIRTLYKSFTLDRMITVAFFKHKFLLYSRFLRTLLAHLLHLQFVMWSVLRHLGPSLHIRPMVKFFSWSYSSLFDSKAYSYTLNQTVNAFAKLDWFCWFVSRCFEWTFYITSTDGSRAGLKNPSRYWWLDFLLDYVADEEVECILHKILNSQYIVIISAVTVHFLVE